MKAQDIVIRPIITEKSMTGVANKKYTFEVCQDANKIEIAKAVEFGSSNSNPKGMNGNLPDPAKPNKE